MCNINSMSMGECLGPKQAQLCTCRTFRQVSYNQKVGCLLCSVVRIYVGEGVRTYARFASHIPCCGQDGYHTQVPQHHKETYLLQQG